MASEATNPLDPIFEKLATCIKNNQHKKALKAADEVLAIEPKNEDALSCKVASYIQQGDYASALTVLNKLPPRSMTFEKAYCLYRTGKLEEGLAAAKTIPETQAEARLQLEAQIHYRLGHNKDCIQLYDTLCQSHKVDSIELKTNVVAAYLAAGMAAEIPALMTAMKVTPKQSFEVGFNKACSFVEAGDWAAAEGELRMALKIGRETLFEEDCTEEEVEEELSPLTVQLGYVLGKMGRTAEAQELYDAVLSTQEEWEEPARAIAYNNSVAESGKADASANHKKYVSSATKRMEAMLDNNGDVNYSQLRLNPSLEARLSPLQKQQFALNRALLYLLAGRLAPAKEVISAVASTCGESPPLGMMRAAVLVAEGKGGEADAALDQLCAALKAAGQPTLLPTLMRAQLALDANAGTRAQELLSGMCEEEATSPAILATRLALHQQMGDNNGAEALLESALASWQKRNKEQAAEGAIAWCLQNLVQLKLKLGKTDDAMSSYQALQRSTGSAKGALSAATTAALAKLARAMSLADPSGVRAFVSEELPAMKPSEMQGMDIDSLEEHLVSRGGASGVKPPVPKKDVENAKREGAPIADNEQQVKKKRTRRKKKPQYPKGYNPELPGGGLPPPNPERWLPKWERSDYRKKKVTSQQRKNETVKGSQGAGKVNESLDRTQGEAPKKEEKSAMPVLPQRKKGGKK